MFGRKGNVSLLSYKLLGSITDMTRLVKDSVVMNPVLKPTAFEWDLYLDRSLVLQQFKHSKLFTDAILVTTDGGEEAVHLVVMSALSDKLTETMYQQVDDPSTPTSLVATDYGEVSVKKILIKEADRESLKAIIDCAYSGLITLNPSNVRQVLEVAQMYRMQDVIEACCSFLTYQLSPKNSVFFFFLGLKNRHQLQISAWNAIKANFCLVVDQSPEFASLSLQCLKSLLDDDLLNVVREESVWEAIRRWVSFDSEDRKQYVNQLLSSLRFYRIEVDYLRTILAKDQLIVDDSNAFATVSQMIKDRTRTLKRRKNPLGLEPMSLRPRTPHEVIFAFGGWLQTKPCSLLETYDNQTNKWFLAKGNLSLGRGYAGVEATEGGVIYFVGGTDGKEYLRSVICFHPLTQKWYESSNMNEKRCFVATALVGGFIYAMGGHNGIRRLKSVEKYDPTRDEWIRVNDMNRVRSDAAATSLNGKIYIAGGVANNLVDNTVEVFDPMDGSWTMIEPMVTPRSSLAVVSYHGAVYALGGNNGFQRLASVEKYDPKTRSWSPAPAMSSVRGTFAACLSQDKLFVFGGYSGQKVVSGVECYDDSTKSWTPLKDLGYARSGLSVIAVEGLFNAREFTYIGIKKRSLLERLFARNKGRQRDKDKETADH